MRTDRSSFKPDPEWIAWVDSLRQPTRQENETIDEWSQRLLDINGRKGRFIQCSLGWHDTCSDPDGDDCKCPCHDFDKRDLINAAIHAEDEV